MKILLIVPNIKSYDVMPCLSVAYLKGFINKKSRHEAKVIDLVFHKKNWENYISKRIVEEKPDLIGFSVLSFNYPEAIEIARYIKNNFDIKIIFGGVHIILSPEEVIEKKVRVEDTFCPYCGEDVKPGSEKCPYCGSALKAPHEK